MSVSGLPDIPLTPVPMRKGVGSIHRNLSFLPPFTSTPKSAIPVRTAKNGVAEKSKPAVVLPQQNDKAAVKPLGSQNRKASEAVLSLKSTDSLQSRSGKGDEAARKALTSRPVGSKGLLPKVAKVNTASAKVVSDPDVRVEKKSDTAVNRNPTERKSVFKAPDPRHMETNEGNLNHKSVSKIKKAQTTVSTNVVKTATLKASGHVDNILTVGSKRVSVSMVPRVQIPREKSSAKINSQVAPSRVSAVQSENSEGLTSEVSHSTRSKKGKDGETLAGSVQSGPMKTRAGKRAATAEISVDLENSTDECERPEISKDKRKKQKVVAEDAGSTQPERRFLKRGISQPKILLPNSSQEKAVKRAQRLDRRKSIEQKDIEMKVKPNIYQRWKLASKPTVEFAMETLTQTFDGKFDSQKETVLVAVLKSFEELKTRLTSEVGLVKVPTSKQPVNYLTLSTQEETLRKYLDETSMDVEQISKTIKKCEKSNEKLKILKERLQSKQMTTSEAERLYEAVSEQSSSEKENE